MTVPLLKFSLSLRSLMMNALSNFLLFTTKQLFQMIKHPDTATFELYPTILWLTSESDDAVAEQRDVEVPNIERGNDAFGVIIQQIIDDVIAFEQEKHSVLINQAKVPV